MRRFLLVLLALSVSACAGGSAKDPASNGSNNGANNGANNGGNCEDLDGDGFDGRSASCPGGIDCDDRSAQTNPGAAEMCGDQRDNNCDGQADEGCMAATCTDNDGDRYGSGQACLGPDCNDNDAAINPAATEVCGNNIDEDCRGGDQVCAENCIDNDMDGYGAPGSTDCRAQDGSILTEVDCNDRDAGINAAATEVCDGKDNNCDGQTDECPGAGQACAGDMCQGGAGAECENHDDCAGQFLKCDRNQNPKICKYAEGGQCNQVDDCIDGLACENNTCTGDFCAVTTCAGTYPHCDRDVGACVECPYWEAEDVADAACNFDTTGESCLPGGWCAFSELIDTDAEGNDINTDAELWWTNVSLAWCWLNIRPNGEKDICSSYYVDAAVQTITKDRARDAYVDGHLDNALLMDQNEALDDVWGEGLFNREEIDWKSNLTPGQIDEVCLWYQPGGLISGETMVLDKCENFTP